MATFIKTGFWEIAQKGFKGWLNLDDLITQVSLSNTFQITGLILPITGWSLVSGLYYYTLSNSNIPTNAIVDIVPDNADIQTVIDAVILSKTTSGLGQVTVAAQNIPLHQ